MLKAIPCHQSAGNHADVDSGLRRNDTVAGIGAVTIPMIDVIPALSRDPS